LLINSFKDCSNVPNNTNTLTSGLFDDFTPAHVFMFDPEYDTPSSTNSIESMRNRHNIILVTPSKLSCKPIGTPQRVPVESLLLPTQETIIRNLENSFTNITQSDTSLPSEPEIQTDPINNENTTQESLPIDPLVESPGKVNTTVVPSTPKVEVEEEVNLVEYLQTTRPDLSSKEIVNICKDLKPEDELENEFPDLQPKNFDFKDEDEDTRKSLFRYSIVKFSSSSVSAQLAQLGKYPHKFGTTTVPKSKNDPTPVRRSNRLKGKSPGTTSKSPINVWN